MKMIDNFNGNFEFLTNYSPHGFFDENENWWKTNEHYYQAHKTYDPFQFEKIMEASTPGRAKKLGQICLIKSDWNELKVIVMTRGLWFKFQDKELKEKLLSTMEYILVEGNVWHDNTWGNCYCKKCDKIEGKNLLGICLMNMREIFYLEENRCQKSTKGNCCVTEKKENC